MLWAPNGITSDFELCFGRLPSTGTHFHSPFYTEKDVYYVSSSTSRVSAGDAVKWNEYDETWS